MRLLNWSPAIRLPLWPRYIQVAIRNAHSEYGSLKLPLRTLCPHSGATWSTCRRQYATVHVSQIDKVFQAPPGKSNGGNGLELSWDQIMDAARDSLDRYSQASQEVKDAVLADLQNRVNKKPSNPGRRRSFLRRLARAIRPTNEPAVAIRKLVHAYQQASDQENADSQKHVTCSTQHVAEHKTADPSHPGPVHIDTSADVLDMDYICRRMKFPVGGEDTLHGCSRALLRPPHDIQAGQIRCDLHDLCRKAGVHMTDECAYDYYASEGANQWRSTLVVRIGDAPYSSNHASFIVATSGPLKRKAHAAAWLHVLSTCYTSGTLMRLCKKIQDVRGNPAITSTSQAPSPGEQDYSFLQELQQKEQYANAPPRLFQVQDISNTINNICGSLKLSQKAQSTLYSTGTRTTCTLTLWIRSITDTESTIGTGENKVAAKRDAWAAMLARLDATGALQRLLAPGVQQRNPAPAADSTIDTAEADEEIELVTVQDHVMKHEKDGKVDVFNYAAKFGLVPQFHINLLKRRVRRPAAKAKSRSVVQASINLPEQGINIVANGATTLQAEVAAFVSFKRAAEEFQAREGQTSDVDRNFEALSTATARDFVEYYRRLQGRMCLEFENESVSYGDLNGTLSQLTLDSIPVGQRVMMRTKKAAEEVAYLTAAIELARKTPDVLAKFASDLSKGALGKRVLGRCSEIRTTLDTEALGIMRHTLVEARQAGLPDIRESLTALEAPMGRIRERMNRQTPAALASKRLLDRLHRFEQDPAMASLRDTRAQLPMSRYSHSVLELVNGDIYSIIVGATGSGKTTQVPQIILDDAIRRGEGGTCDIICTQPRRLAASSVAQRVAAERGEQLRESIGYQVRGDAKLPQLGGSITFCTTGLLLERLKWDPDGLMDGVSHLVLDEVHERDIFIDFLLIVLKKAVKVRQAAGRSVPRIVLMSATMDKKLFSEYLANEVDGRLTPCPLLDVPGRTFPVKEKYLGDILGEILTRNASEFWDLTSRDRSVTQEYLDAESAFERDNGNPDTTQTAIDWKRKQTLNPEQAAAQALQKEEGLVPIALLVATIAHICRSTTDGAVLAFLPGLQEITATEELLKMKPIFGVDFANEDAFHVHSLHSTVPVDKQQLIFGPSPKGCRKIILSTNIAETSVTVPDVKHVVDLGKLRENRYDQIQRITGLQTVWESNSNARQRAGRAGRVSSGTYYALYSRQRRNAMSASGLPELLRSDLQETCLSIKAQGFEESVSSFLSSAIEPPAQKAIEVAVDNLKAIEAFTDNEQLTALGNILAKLPIHPALGKMILLGIIFRCLDPVIIIGSMGAERSLFASPPGERVRVRRAKESFNVADSDHIAAMKAFQELRRYQNDSGQSSASSYAHECMLHLGAFRAIHQTAQQIEKNLIDAGLLDVRTSHGTHNHEFGGKALNRNSSNLDLVKCLLLAGVYPNVGVRSANTKSPLHRTASEDKVLMHPSSVNACVGRAKPAQKDEIYAFTTLARPVGGDCLFMRDTTLLPPLVAILFGGRLEAQGNYHDLSMDEWLRFRMSGHKDYASRLAMEFRKGKDRMLNGVFKSLADSNRRALADDPVREIFANGLVELLDAARGQKSGIEEWVPEGWFRQSEPVNEGS